VNPKACRRSPLENAVENDVAARLSCTLFLGRFEVAKFVS
jgi:hypothetical protein